MLASLFRPKNQIYAEHSPFSSPDTTRNAPPFFRNQGQASGTRNTGIRDHNEDHEYDIAGERGGDAEYENSNGDIEDEDDPQETSPLLPIFSASHLGMAPLELDDLILWKIKKLILTILVPHRFFARVRRHPCHTFAHRRPLRDHFVVGPIALASDFSVPGETHSTENYGITLFQSLPICSDDKLSPVQQGSPSLSGE